VATGLPTLDKQLQGGFPVGAITEIVGRAGVGKTQLSQQLCVLAAISGRGGSIYIDTENKMSVLRLKEIANERNCGRKRGAREAFSANKTDPADQVLENVTVHSMLSTQELMYALERLEAEINQRNSEAENSGSQNSRCVDRLPVKLIIIDSIAAPIRRDYDLMTSASAKPSSETSSIQRATAIFQIARKLKQLADDHRLAVVAVNQVGAGGSSFGETGQRNDTLDMNEGEVTASLGTAWQYCISTRIALEHEEDPHFNPKQIHTRKAVITKSLISKKAELNYEVTLQGVREVIPRER
jgi:RAD51-like protein 1